MLRVEMAGAGGYGLAEERDPEAIRADIAQGKVTAAHAREVYGVE
ncbi:hypothetical protein [Chenggangzhangella methanolivorans]|nr:hypothetical protein [Chenggangzhangella methanolivorans]